MISILTFQILVKNSLLKIWWISNSFLTMWILVSSFVFLFQIDLKLVVVFSIKKKKISQSWFQYFWSIQLICRHKCNFWLCYWFFLIFSIFKFFNKYFVISFSTIENSFIFNSFKFLTKPNVNFESFGPHFWL